MQRAQDAPFVSSGPSSLLSCQRGEVAPSLHHLRCRIRLDPHPSTLRSRILPAPHPVPPCFRSCLCAGPQHGLDERGHLLHPYNPPSKTKPGGSIRRSRRCEGERGLSYVWDKTCFIPLLCCSSFLGSWAELPVQGHTAASLGEQLCMLWCVNISVGF